MAYTQDVINKLAEEYMKIPPAAEKLAEALITYPYKTDRRGSTRSKAFHDA
jgi:hypothetical protein